MTAPFTPGLTPAESRQTLGRLALGVAILTLERAGEYVGVLARTCAPVSTQPPLVAVGVDRDSEWAAWLAAPETERFGVNLLGAGQRRLLDAFAGSAAGQGVPWFTHEGLPLIGGTVAQLVCRRERRLEVGDQLLFAGLIEYSRYTDDDPLIAFRGQYHELG